MSLKNLISIYFSIAIPMTILDAFWLGLMAKKLYSPRIGHLMSTTPNWTAAVIFYLMYIAGAMYFVVLPTLKSNASLSNVWGMGALLGLLAYATYDLTNQATLKNWSWTVTCVDLAWGALLTGTVCCVAVYICRKLILIHV